MENYSSVRFDVILNVKEEQQSICFVQKAAVAECLTSRILLSK